jgi:hypothetical protein
MHAAVQPGTFIKHSGLLKWIGMENLSGIDRPTASKVKLIISGAALTKTKGYKTIGHKIDQMRENG